jgi:anti-anti-sigma factor
LTDVDRLALTIASNGHGASDSVRSTVVAVEGEIDLGTSAQLRQALTEVFDEGSTDITVDLAAVEFIDATGIGTLVAASNKAHSLGGRLRLRAPSHAVRRILRIFRLHADLSLEG